MLHKTIKIDNLGFATTNKTLFKNFTTQVHCGDKIAIIGKNGSGKSTLVKILAGIEKPSIGNIIHENNLIIGYVPQIINDFFTLSGAEQFNYNLTKALTQKPNLLLLDEPTNHLDEANHKTFMRWIEKYVGTLIIVTHNEALLQNHINTFWDINEGKIEIFKGKYVDYMAKRSLQEKSIKSQLLQLEKSKNTFHHKLMKEQDRIKKSKQIGQKNIKNRKWLKSVGKDKAQNAENSAGKKFNIINKEKNILIQKLKNIKQPKIIIPKFSINTNNSFSETILEISNGKIGYSQNKIILNNINLNLTSHQRIAILGDNGSGKSTLIKAILNHSKIYKTGDWHLIPLYEIGYLDQHYKNLNDEVSVYETISNIRPDWKNIEIRKHLSDFLFYTNEQVMISTKFLSGGEKARLSLAQIGAKTPKLLLLDEITNNLDLDTCKHITQVLKQYPGSMIIISHNQKFLEQIDIDQFINIKEFMQN